MTEPAEPVTGGPVELLALALSRPNEALERARGLLAGHPADLEAAVARQAIGIVLREFGDVEAAVRELRLARRAARRAGAAGREADILGTLGTALVFAGRTASGRRALDTAISGAAGHLRGRLLFRRGAMMDTLGLHEAALRDLNEAVPALEAAGDQVWAARARTARAFVSLARGAVRPAVSDLECAERLISASGQVLEAIDAIGNRGVLAATIGDLPLALTCFDEATERFTQLGVPDVEFPMARCATLLAAGLPGEALLEALRVIEFAERVGLRPTRRAELLLTAAGCALAAGDPERALRSAGEAGRLFVRQGRSWWAAHARLTAVRATLAFQPATPGLARAARRCVRELAAMSSPDLLLARLTAAAVARPLGLDSEADEHLRAASARRHTGPALSRAQAWLAVAWLAEARGDARGVWSACRRGLAVIDEHCSALGSWELRAQVTAHGAALAQLGVSHAAARGRPRQQLVWSERWRAVAHAVPAVRPPDDEELQADLAALRSVSHQLGNELATRGGQAVAHLERERQRLERAIRARELRRRSAAGRGTLDHGPLDVRALLGVLGEDRLVELSDVGGRLHVLVCGSGTVRRYQAGTTEQAVREVMFARFSLTRLGSRPAAVTGQAMQQVAAVGAVLEQVLLGEAAGHLGGGRVIVVPPGRLHAVPWALLPRLAARVFTVAPSAASWLRAWQTETDAGASPPGGAAERVVLVRGPGLVSQGLEIDHLVSGYTGGSRPTVLGGGTATVASVLAAMDGAALVHVAAHGTFRADSPLFSSLVLDDGPLTLYDLAGLRRGPRRLVLPSCDSGVVAPVGADEILGLASSLLPLGTTGIVASLVPVDDHSVVPLMVHLHARLRDGAGLAEALRDVRAAAAGPGGSPLALATAQSFIALGADVPAPLPS